VEESVCDQGRVAVEVVVWMKLEMAGHWWAGAEQGSGLVVRSFSLVGEGMGRGRGAAFTTARCSRAAAS
jgi:hypothetical protein